ncbi:MAG: ribulose-phosphate 3-epimerase [Coriobacteriales bacterium]|nr:ribulose-phosphate 3-epimerase [Coriobacteriaceae bacterium]MDY2723539.1 ribulose-phosphate 3-epimerase [Coriobacteriales bacterium]
MFGKTCIAPSILSADFMNLGADVRLVSEGGADWIHVDVMDGHFVPNLTIGPAHVKALKKITDVPLDVHLMIDNPEVQVSWYLEAGADSVTIHCEATDDAAALIDAIHAAGAKAGVSINPETDTSVLAGLVDKCDLVLMMSVHPGFGGQSFIESTPERITQVVELCKAADANPIIEVDGGINAKTAPLVVARGADLLVAGSAVFKAADPVEAMAQIRGAHE